MHGRDIRLPFQVHEFLALSTNFWVVHQETAWPLLGLLLRQTVSLQSDPAGTFELQCDTLKNLRWGLKTLGLGSGEKTIQQVLLTQIWDYFAALCKAQYCL